MQQINNEQYERALKSMAMSDSETLVHYMFSLWVEALKELLTQREIDAARERMQRMKNAQCERALKAFVMSDTHSMMHYCFSVWHDDLKEIQQQREFDAARDQLQLIHNEQYERALKSMAMSDTKSLVHYMFSLWVEVLKEAVKQLEIDAARQRMKNAQCERALKAFVMSDTQSSMHYCFSVWHEAQKEAKQQREFDEARERMQQMNNEQYERA